MYTLSDSMSETAVECEDLAEAREEARDWARGGDWGDGTEYVYVDVAIRDASGEQVDKVTVAIEPEAPQCEDGGDAHDWQTPVEIVGGISENPGCWGHGGGVVQHECCMRCGCRRTTDTWAQRHDTGEQGLTEVTYEEGYYTARLAELAESEE